MFGEWISFLKFGEYRKRLLLLMVPWLAVGTSSYGIHFSVRFVVCFVECTVLYFTTHKKCLINVFFLIFFSFVQYDIFVVSLVKDAAIVFVVAILTGIYDRVIKH